MQTLSTDLFLVRGISDFALVLNVGGLFVICVMWKLWTCAPAAKKNGKQKKT